MEISRRKEYSATILNRTKIASAAVLLFENNLIEPNEGRNIPGLYNMLAYVI
jgi:hypothetical protein